MKPSQLEDKKSEQKINTNSVFHKFPLLAPSLIFLGCVFGFMLISWIYLGNAFDNQAIRQGDMEQVKNMTWEAKQYKEIHGHNPGWSSKIFGGMPGNLISGSGKSTGNLLYDLKPLEFFGIQGHPFNFLFVAMLSMFVLLLSSGAKYWLSAAGAIGYAFMTFSISSYEAGHITKVLAMGAMPGVLAGLILLTKKKYWWGAATLALFFGTTVMYFHYQVVYYAGIFSGIYLVCLLIYLLIEKDFKHLAKVVAFSAVAFGIGLLANYGKIKDTQEYAKKTMRGGSENIEDSKTKESAKTSKSGLNVDYAFAWSYGIDESLTTFIPGSKGGSSGEIYEGERYPMYHGDLSFTSGPIYIGAIFIMLFFVGIVIVLMLPNETDEDKKLKRQAVMIMIFSLLTTFISYLLALGRNADINTWFFNHLPYYDKFRTPMMALSIAQLTIPFFALYSLGLFIKVRDKINIKNMLIASGITVVVLLIISAMVIGSENFNALGDKEMSPENVSMMKSLRSDYAWGDFRRTFLFCLVAFGLIFAFAKKYLNGMILGFALIVLISFDLIGVSKRYLTDENWVEKSDAPAAQPTKNDEDLMRVNKTYARVYDLRSDPFNSNNANVFHRNIGGYHPAKLGRYQDLIANGFTPSGEQLNSDYITVNPSLDMMNCRYVLSADQKTGKEQPIFERRTACGNGWFVSKITDVASQKEAISKIKTFNPHDEAIFETAINKSKPSANQFSRDSTAKIDQVYFSPDTIDYVSKNANNGFAVFSEIYYNEAIGSWKAYIDGKESNVFQVNYLLRGLEVPSGEHKIKFVYEVKDAGKLNLFELIFSSIAVFGIIILLIVGISGKTKLASTADELLDN